MKRILIILVFILLGCGSRKVEKQKTEIEENKNKTVLSEEKKNDSAIIAKEEKVSSKLNYTLKNNELSFEPIDNSRPFFIGGKKYENVRVKEKESTKDFTKETEILKNELEKRFSDYQKKIDSLIIQSKKQKTESKKVDKKESVLNYWWVLVLLGVLYLIYKNYSKVWKFF